MYLKVMMPKRFQFRMVPSFKNFLLDRKGDIHYIGGADVLPAPLEPAEEAEVIADLGTEYDDKADGTSHGSSYRTCPTVSSSSSKASLQAYSVHLLKTLFLYMPTNRAAHNNPLSRAPDGH